MSDKPLFIPLKIEYYDAFADGRKMVEYRRYGPVWNERTCVPGRRVVLSKGYGKKSRCEGVVVRCWPDLNIPSLPGFIECYGAAPDLVACCIEIKLNQP